MTASIYELVGRLVVRLIRVRYRKQIRIAAALGIGAVAVAGYVAMTREPPEG
jgi:predicted transcriptional regulator